MTELAGLPGLLAKVPANEIESLIESPSIPVPDILLPRLVRSVARRRRRSPTLVAGSIVAAALTAAAAIMIAVPFGYPGVGPATPGACESAVSVTSVVLDRVVPGALSADVRLVAEGGTRASR